MSTAIRECPQQLSDDYLKKPIHDLEEAYRAYNYLSRDQINETLCKSGEDYYVDAVALYNLAAANDPKRGGAKQQKEQTGRDARGDFVELLSLTMKRGERDRAAIEVEGAKRIRAQQKKMANSQSTIATDITKSTVSAALGFGLVTEVFRDVGRLFASKSLNKTTLPSMHILNDEYGLGCNLRPLRKELVNGKLKKLAVGSLIYGGLWYGFDQLERKYDDRAVKKAAEAASEDMPQVSVGKWDDLTAEKIKAMSDEEYVEFRNYVDSEWETVFRDIKKINAERIEYAEEIAEYQRRQDVTQRSPWSEMSVHMVGIGLGFGIGTEIINDIYHDRRFHKFVNKRIDQAAAGRLGGMIAAGECTADAAKVNAFAEDFGLDIRAVEVATEPAVEGVETATNERAVAAEVSQAADVMSAEEFAETFTPTDTEFVWQNTVRINGELYAFTSAKVETSPVLKSLVDGSWSAVIDSNNQITFQAVDRDATQTEIMAAFQGNVSRESALAAAGYVPEQMDAISFVNSRAGDFAPGDVQMFTFTEGGVTLFAGANAQSPLIVAPAPITLVVAPAPVPVTVPVVP